MWSMEMLVIGMGAETVVDYALRFKKQYGPDTWVCGYADDMIAYIPSRRVWEEGGYEGGSNLYEYGRPAFRWAGDIEDRIAATVDAVLVVGGRKALLKLKVSFRALGAVLGAFLLHASKDSRIRRPVHRNSAPPTRERRAAAPVEQGQPKGRSAAANKNKQEKASRLDRPFLGAPA